MFSADDVTWFLDTADRLGIDVWLDGGWGVDALVGRQTRPHHDLDIILSTPHGAELVAELEAQGFVEIELESRRSFNFVFGHPDGRKIDFHQFDRNPAGDGVYGSAGPVFTSEALSGNGSVAGRRVRCIDPATVVRFHTGYAHDADDVHDVLLLCSTFGIEIPEQYRS